MRMHFSLVLPLMLLIAAGCGRPLGSQASAAQRDAQTKGSKSMSYVRVRTIGPNGSLSEAREVPVLALSEAEWRKRLTPDQYRITRGKGTEPAFCGGLLHEKGFGMFVCVCCNLPLFESTAKFESGSGWPSFFQPVAKENIREKADHSHGMVRTEILCQRCGAHLGHVFDDGPRPTGLRYCLNSEALRFVARGELKSIAEPAPRGGESRTAVASNASRAERAEAVFAGGCFWCVEAVFRQLDGVGDVTSGYAGGAADTANYEVVSSGRTGHAEAVKIVYDPRKISYEQLLKVHFATHDPTTRNRQGNDVGTQYRSAVFYANDEQKQLAEAMIADLNRAKVYRQPIVTSLEPLRGFYPAEAHHQDFVACNLHNPYVRSVALPKVAKVRAKFQDLLKSPADARLSPQAGAQPTAH
jgi:peptide methionine sulfoxide reductase msrA/msrB